MITEDPNMMLNDEAALEMVLAYLDAPPLEGSEEDRLFGRALRHVNSVVVVPPDEPREPALSVNEDLMRRLADLERRREEGKPFGSHPDGLGPTLGMDVSHS
jgi:hypothetical protein